MKSLFLFVGIIAFGLVGFYLMPSDYFESLQINQVFAQSENKKFENAVTTQSSETATKSMDNKFQGSIEEDILPESDSPLDSKENEQTLPIGKSPKPFSKIHPKVTHILEDANPNAVAKIYGVKMDNDKLFVYVHLDENKKPPTNIEILSQYKNIIQTKLNLEQIKSLITLDSIKRITLPNYANFYGHGQSEGIEFSGADEFHNAGFNGTGIKVAILDDSFILSNPEINNTNISVKWFSPACGGSMACNLTDGNSHGTAVAEIIVDMAPKADLLLYSIVTDVDFFNAIDNATAENADIITASFGFPTISGDLWWRDGSSEPADKVNEANSTGILFTVAAGNDGDAHWSGFYDILNTTSLEPGEFQLDMNTTGSGPEATYESVMKFNSSAIGNMQACLPVTTGTSVYQAIWNSWPVTTDDYDFLLYDRNMTNFLSAILRIQNGDSNSEPQEFISGTNEGETCLVLASDSSSEDHLFHIYHGNDNSLNIPDNDPNRLGSIDTPADAAGAFTVGAVNFNSTSTNYSDDALEVFSSQGPTDDGRLKPEICGPDGTLTHQTTFPGSPFVGTSASTPHVAAAAALLLEQNPSLDVNQLKQKLIDDARSGVFSVDNKCGSDSGSLRLVLDSTITVTKTAIDGDDVFDFTTTVTDETRDGNFTGNGGFSINTSVDNTITFTGLSPDLNYTITESAEPGWQLDTLSCTGGANTLTSGTTVTLDPNPGEQIDCTYTNSIPPPCSPPPSGNWTVNSSCTMTGNETIINGDLIVQNSSVLTIPNGVTLDIDFANHNLTVEFGSGILIKSGGKIT